jgi:hypothetical protein
MAKIYDYTMSIIEEISVNDASYNKWYDCHNCNKSYKEIELARVKVLKKLLKSKNLSTNADNVKWLDIAMLAYSEFIMMHGDDDYNEEHKLGLYS